MPKIAYSIADACELAGGLSKQSLYDEINAGRLRTFTVGRRRLVGADALSNWVREREREAAAGGRGHRKAS